MKNSILNRSNHFFIAISFVVYIVVILLNDGFMATDEYWTGITRYIPAQKSSLANLVGPDDVKSPLQILPMHALAQTAYQLGVETPYLQYRFVILILGLLNIALLFFALKKLCEALKLNNQEQNFLWLMLTFYFAAPFGLTRPMFESIAAPWPTLAGVYGLLYDKSEKKSDLLKAVFFVSVAFVLRQQLGFCALALIALALLKKKWNHVLWAGGVGLLFFVLAGIPDYFLRGQFHFSLLNLTIYNYHHGAEYGDRPITFYPVLIFIICFIPFLIKKYPKNFFKQNFIELKTFWMMLFLFVFLHSLFPQKWERFIISLIPILIFLIRPFLYYIHQHFSEHKFRLTGLYSINGILFVVATFFPAQKNLIEMSLYLDKHPEIKKIYRTNDIPGWITEAFILNKNFEYAESNLKEVQAVDWSDCSKALVLGQFQLPEFQEVTSKLHLVAKFKVNLIEQVSYRLNPKNNQRRVELSFFSGCQLER